MLKRMGVLWWKPIWNVAVQQGVRTAAFYWPGSDTGRSLVYLKRMMLQYLIVPGSRP
jgi:hypothetical protein